MIAFWVLLIWAIYALIAGVTRRPGQDGPGSRPDGGAQDGGARQILDERLARGEIDAEEHQRLRGLLGGGTGRAAAGSGSTR